MSAIEIRSLYRRYGRRTVIEDLSLTVGAGQIYGLLGPNGSGKTTTLACTLGLLRASGGTTTVLGTPSSQVHRLRGRLGVVFDTAIALPGLTARQNLGYLRSMLGRRATRSTDEVLELVGLSALGRSRAGSLSLGERKRLAIAGALLGHPELLVLDEPLAGLDTLGVRAALELFRDLAGQGVTMVLSSHRLHEMQTVVTHAGILLGGRIEREGSLAELLGATRGRWRLMVSDPPRAREVLGSLEGVELERHPEGTDPGELIAHLGVVPPAAVNRALIEAGLEVSRLEPAGRTLQAVFESLVDAQLAQGGAA